LDKNLANSLWFVPLTVLSASAYSADYLSVAQAQRIIFPANAVFVEDNLALTKDERKQIKKLSGVRQRQDQQPVWQVKDGDKMLGWFIMDDVIGKHEYITYGVGISPAGEVLGVEIMSYRETHGGQIREQSWRDNFKGKTLADPFKLDKDVPNISGATLSCRNVLDGVKRLLVMHKLRLAGRG